MITLIPLHFGDPDHTLTVPDGSEWYWAQRCLSLLTGQLAGVEFSAPTANNRLPWLGQIKVNDETARRILTRWHTGSKC